MPRKYYCDFCKCSFPDNATNRQKHNNGTVHKSNRQIHYDWFKDPNEFIQEQINKPPCRRYLTQGYCDYQLQCRYSHITYDPTGRLIYPPELLNWLQERQQADEAAAAEVLAATTASSKKDEKPKYRLPRGWKIRELPPSLKPPPSSQPYSYSHSGVWG
ncbi:hypothetical protein BDC45DRAFT_328095 [Circinella umbellata]|nr:hypothetical protein BDC45DRAFT_328095 [Circinella umbellata]